MDFSIDLKLDKDFTTQLDYLISKYGPDLAKLNGFANEQLNYTDFIDNFIDKQTVPVSTAMPMSAPRISALSPPRCTNPIPSFLPLTKSSMNSKNPMAWIPPRIG